MASVSIRIPDDLRDELDAVSRQQSRAASEIVRDSLRQYLARERFQAVRRKTQPFAEAQGLLTDEDVFRAIT